MRGALGRALTGHVCNPANTEATRRHPRDHIRTIAAPRHCDRTGPRCGRRQAEHQPPTRPLCIGDQRSCTPLRQPAFSEELVPEGSRATAYLVPAASSRDRIGDGPHAGLRRVDRSRHDRVRRGPAPVSTGGALPRAGQDSLSFSSRQQAQTTSWLPLSGGGSLERCDSGRRGCRCFVFAEVVDLEREWSCWSRSETG